MPGRGKIDAERRCGLMKTEQKRGFLDRFFPAGIRPACPKCGHQGFIVLHDDAVVNADKPIAIVACASEDCHAALGVLPASAVWDE
ncbi:hypothetical protein CX042_02810 [Bordetella pertussis]|uniref:Uncharacterized protein n=10 Tax=Bordetella TaxID=517 RepID=Q7VTL4_BORPE|nr:hypothetical protein BPTD_3461 [Bordetella pertussis CS]AIW93522.1 hypothetical protein B1917_3291 [Bordetella pertussis B1917]AIW94553.1 hypothetical protein B1920_0554 [Bordetella pertussis B1920]AJB25412.1 hypothetical protein Q425_5920 [Bordetella pertussis 137]ALH50573.1 hypothetical protein B1838_3294 [Bordetella pertussis]AMG88306.1 hypothetical protein AL472_11335 [Bordetella bronchiseptica]AOB39603.1 hypothetical protein BBB43_12730 [Bordetella parapertussis]PNO98537.1 hypothetic